MPTKEQEKRIICLYQMYNNDIKPLTYYIESKYFKYPKGLLKKYRDVFDYIAMCYTDNADQIDNNLREAESQLEHIRYNIYRYVCDYEKKEFSRWKKRYNKYDLQGINNGDFWKEILKKEDDAEKKFLLGRKLKSEDIAKACTDLQESFQLYYKIHELIKNNQQYIIDVKFKYVKVTIGNHVVGFLGGVVASIVAAFLYSFISC